MVMLQLVDQVMAVKHMRTSLSLTEERIAQGMMGVRGTKTSIRLGYEAKTEQIRIKLIFYTFSNTISD